MPSSRVSDRRFGSPWSSLGPGQEFELLLWHEELRPIVYFKIKITDSVSPQAATAELLYQINAESLEPCQR